MVNIFGKSYYLDLDGIINACRVDNKNNEIDITDEDVDINNNEDIEDTDDDGGLEINLFKYELIKICIDRVLYEGEDIDEKMGGFGSNTPMSFKIAFNTLIKNQILISEDDE